MRFANRRQRTVDFLTGDRPRRHRALRLGASLCLVAWLASCGACVRRTMTITTEPRQALIYLNDQEIGRTNVSTDFLWYGDYDVIIRKEGYQTLHTHWEVEAPWYQWIPLDFFFEVLWPSWLHDHHEAHFVLEPLEKPDTQALLERAAELRREAKPLGG
jgi:hypothetical protein